MTGVWVNVKIRIRNPLLQNEAIGRRNDNVVIAIRYKHRDLDLPKTIVRPINATCPFDDRLRLSLSSFWPQIIGTFFNRPLINSLPPCPSKRLFLLAELVKGRQKCSFPSSGVFATERIRKASLEPAPTPSPALGPVPARIRQRTRWGALRATS